MLCPVCGGLIHPIAGRCKHCKTDLSAFRAQRPQAAAQLPALAQRSEPVLPIPQQHAAIPQQVTGGGINGHSAPTLASGPAAPSPWAPPSAHEAYQEQSPAAGSNPPAITPTQLAQEASQPILPPRPSGMSWTHMQRQAPPRSAWRSWPMVVIIVAMVAIVTAVVIMVWPTSSRADVDKKGNLDPPPAPERMDSKPTPQKAPADDPWGPSGALAPKPSTDPLAPAAAGVDNSDAMAMAFGKHLCDRLAKCANVGSFQSMCSQMIPNGSPPTCAAAQRCLDYVDTMSCSLATDDTDISSLQTLLMKVPDCIDAMKC